LKRQAKRAKAAQRPQRDSDLANGNKGLIWRTGVVAGLLLVAVPLAAQENSAANAPPPAADNIGPRELSNFSLNGTVTRPAERQPAAQPPVTAVREPSRTAPAPAASATDGPAPVRSMAVQPRRNPPTQPVTIDPILSRPTLRQPSSGAPATSTPAFAQPVSAPPPPVETPIILSPLPWIAALLLIGAGAMVYYGQQRRSQRPATPVLIEFVGQAPEPRPASPPPAVRPMPAPPPAVRRPEEKPAAAVPPRPVGTVASSLRAPPKPAGVVSSSLRPWIELELAPSQALVNDEHAAIAFDVTLFNSGSAPARDVAVEACLINAGQQQDAQLNEVYKTPGEVRDKIPAVAPLARITLKSAVRLPRSAVQEYEVEGRKLFMPMVAVNSRYRWSSGEGQSAASFLIGRGANDREKLAPLRLDQGAKGWKGLAARRYEKGIRR
jgi:hypothetical protein